MKCNHKGYKIKLISIFTLKPINENFILNNLNTKNVLTIEENVSIGGLGSLIAHIILKSKKNRKINFNSLSLEDIVHNKIGSQEYLRKINKLDPESIIKTITRFLNE